VPGEDDLKGGGVSSCATCDGFLYSGKPVVVVGGGDTAMEDALVLARTSTSVVLIHRREPHLPRASHSSAACMQVPTTAARRGTASSPSSSHLLFTHHPLHRRDSFRASKVLANAVLSNPKITVMWNSTVAEFKAIEGSNVLGSVAVRSTTDETNVTEIPAEAAFVAIGHIPNTQLFNGQLEMTENGCVIASDGL
jgi:thioredoxin reductase (NADPH)